MKIKKLPIFHSKNFDQMIKDEKELRRILNKNSNNSDTILDVKNLKVYFKYANHGANKYNKAVHDVSFSVKRGEIFGLVGESGCGKTTTGRAIIRLYPATSGSIYFNGVRTSYGDRFDQKEIKYTLIRAKKAIKEIEEAKNKEIKELSSVGSFTKEELNTKVNEINARYQAKIDEIDDATSKTIAKSKELIKEGTFDNKNFDKEYAKKMVEKVQKHFDRVLGAFESSKLTEEEQKKYEELKALKERLLKRASKESIMSHMQMIFQDPISSLNPRMTVKEIISEGLVIKGIKDKEYIDHRVNEALKMVGLVKEHATRYPHEFSGGQRQRIGIARALIMEPEMIIADEPISALDVSIQAQVINLLNDIKKEMDLTILFVAHDLSVVKYFCNRIAVMYYGNIVELATSEELFKHPLHPYTKSLLSAIPEPDPIGEKGRVRIKYDPSKEVYKDDKPSLKEVSEGHFVYCDTKKFEEYKKVLKDGK